MQIPLMLPGLYWFEDILDEASIDLDLVNLLLERVVQFRNDIEPKPGRQRIAKASIKYIQVSDSSLYVFKNF